jgi:hypothetical protein
MVHCHAQCPRTQIHNASDKNDFHYKYSVAAHNRTHDAMDLWVSCCDSHQGVAAKVPQPDWHTKHFLALQYISEDPTRNPGH